MSNSYDTGFMGEPPKLFRDNFSIWKHRMLSYLESMDRKLLNQIKERWLVPTRKDYKGDPFEVSEKCWTGEEFAKAALDSKAKYILVQSIPDDILHSVINCGSAKEIWDTLGVLFEGTAETRESKRKLLIQQYELFDSKPGESITDTYIRFNCLLDDLKQHGTTFDNKDILDKFLQSLQSSALSKFSMAVKLSKDLNTMPLETRLLKDLNSLSLEALYGKFLAHELKTTQKEMAQNKGKNHYPDLVSSSSIGAGNGKDESDREDASSDEGDLEDLGEAMVKLALKYRKLARKSIFKRTSGNK